MKQEDRSGTIQHIISWFRRKRKVKDIQQRSGGRASASTRINVGNPWHAVGIQTGVTCCRAAVTAKNVRYLSSEAPPLPLAGCSQSKTCLCKYRHFSDRRRGPRREADRFQNTLSRRVISKSIQERRVSRGRRATDGQ